MITGNLNKLKFALSSPEEMEAYLDNENKLTKTKNN